jgi:TIR domain
LNWRSDHVRLFITHTHEHRGMAKQIKEALVFPYRVDAFVAHDDIEPTRLWEDEITNALRTCDALLALLTPGFHESKWCDQEVGWVLGRDMPLVASVNMGATPHGFIGRFQAIPRFGDDPARLRTRFIGRSSIIPQPRRPPGTLLLARWKTQTPSLSRGRHLSYFRSYQTSPIANLREFTLRTATTLR